MIKRLGTVQPCSPRSEYFYPQYMLPCVRSVRFSLSKLTKGHMTNCYEGSDFQKEKHDPPSSEIIYQVSTGKLKEANEDDDVGITSTESNSKKWLFLTSPEWRAELDKTPIEPCYPESLDPNSWVYMSTKEIPDEFWTQRLDFSGYDHVTDILQDSLNGGTYPICPQKVVSLFHQYDLPTDKCKRLVEKLHKVYLDSELYEWAEELETLAGKYITKKTIQECLDVSESESDLSDLSLLFHDDCV